MNLPILGSKVKALLGSARPSGHHLDELELVAEVQKACDRIAARIDDPDVSRAELVALAGSLEPVGRHLACLHRCSKSRKKNDRAARLLGDALHQVYECLYCIQPLRPYVWPDALRTRLRRTLRDIDQALVAVRWANVPATASAS